MSELISGKEALIALANGREVDACVTHRLKKDEWHWFDAKNLTVNEIEAMETEGDTDGENILAIAFRLKPRTITFNGIEVPAPFEPRAKDDCRAYVIDTRNVNGYDWQHSSHCNPNHIVWRTEEEIKQVITALRKVFNNS